MVATLEFYEGVDIWADSSQVVQDDSRVGIMRSAVESIVHVDEALSIFKLPPELILPLKGTQKLHVFAQISEDFRHFPPLFECCDLRQLEVRGCVEGV